MKKSKIAKLGIAVVTAMIILALAGCPSTADGELNGAAVVTSINVAGVDVTPVPAPVARSAWTDAEFSLFDLEANQVGEAVIKEASSLTNAAIRVQASSGAKVKYAAADIDKPTAFQDSPITLNNNGYLCIQVTSEDGKTTNYYVVQILLSNTVTSLMSVTVAEAQASLGTPNADYTKAVPGMAALNDTNKTNAAVAVVKSNPSQTVTYAKVTGNDAPVFADTASFTFADGDFLYIEVTAENGINKTVYKIEIQIGRDTTLSTLSIGGVAVSETARGTSASTLAAAVPGSVLLQGQPPYAIDIAPTDGDASAGWAAVGKIDTSDPTFGTDASLTFEEGGALAIRVTAANGTTVSFYKITVSLPQTGTIKFGQPEIKPSSEKYVDPLWNDATLQEYVIERVYAGDSRDEFINAPNTRGVAKALWDEDGLYVYVEVTDPSIDVSGAGDHEKDSLELFINEGVDGDGNVIKTPVGYAGRGGQYRVNAAGVITGDAPALTKGSAWSTPTGYIVIMMGPWRAKGQYPVADQKKIGFELQINACSNTGRDGVLAWNNSAASNYQNSTNFGEAILDLAGQTIKVNARDALISAHPLSKVYTLPVAGGADPLTVAATSPDSGNLTYQWYSNTANSYESGTAIGTGTSYNPDISTEGTTYYWVEITNTITDNNDGGRKTATIQSGIAAIKVSSVPLIEKITTRASSAPVYGFTPPMGSTWADYKSLTYTVMVEDQASFDQTAVRMYVAGSYGASDFVQGIHTSSNWGGERLITITDGSTLAEQLGVDGPNKWATLSNEISAMAGGYHLPDAAETGPFYLAFGPTLNPNSNRAGSITFYIKDIALVKADGTTKLYADALDTPVGSVTVGQLWCKFDVNDGTVIRTMEPDPTPMVEKITTRASSAPVYGFTPPMGSTWADYKSLTYTVMVEDQASFDQTAVRMYVAGSYGASDFVQGIHTSSNWGGERLITITDNSTLAEQLGVDGPNKWATLSNEISAMAGGYHLPEAAETGPFYLAFGPTLNPNSNRAGSITFYIKDIALVKTDGTTKLYADALDTPVGSVTVGELWCKFDVNDGTVIRTVVPEPTPAP